MTVEHFDATSFQTAIERGITLVDFWAVWCGPCKMQGAILDKLELPEALQGRVRIGKLDIDAFPAVAAQYRVQSIPTLILFKDGAPIDTMVGVQRADTLIDKLTQRLD